MLDPDFRIDPLFITTVPIADVARALRLWARERLVTELLLLAEERGIRRGQHQVFAVAPHPFLSGSLRVENLVAMDLPVWHHICSQLRLGGES